MLRILLITLLISATPAAAQSLQERMLQAEDARPMTEAALAPLREGLQGNLRRTAIRAIGRLERPELIPMIAPDAPIPGTSRPDIDWNRSCSPSPAHPATR